MNFRKSFVVGLGCVALMGCSGGAVVETSIFAGDQEIVPGDFIGKTFPVRYIGAREGAGVELLRGTGSITVVADDIVELTVGGRTYTLTYNALDDEYQSGPDVSADITQEYPEIVTGFAEDVDSLYAGVYGFETSTADMPTSDVFVYADPTGSSLIATNGIGLEIFEGAVSLFVSFGSGVVTGDVFDDGGFAISVQNGMISGNGFSGTLSATGESGAVALASSDVDGTFFGNEADRLFGSYEGTFADPEEVEGITSFVGGFLTEKGDL